MNEPTHKIVNGVRLELTPEEINQTKESWRIEDEKRAIRMKVRQEKLDAKVRTKEKLKSLGLSEEEISFLI